MKSAQKRAILGAIVGMSLAAGIFGCPASFPDVGPFESTDSGDADGQIIPPGCDLTKDPKDSLACVDDSIGVFVSSGGGSDSNAGTKGSPLKTITAALAKVDSQHSRVYVCEGTYGETVKVTKSLGLYGGFSCTDWSYGTTQGTVGPTGAGYALDIEGATGNGVTVEDLEFDSQNGVNPGDSSIAIFVSSSTVTLKRVKAMAGNGATGADAIATSNYDAGAVDAGALNGNAGSGFTGGAEQDCTGLCADGSHSVGGRGGDSNLAGADGGPAIPANPNDGFHDGLGGTSGIGCSSHFGASASPADGGTPSASQSGHLSADGWALANGANGGSGTVAQGGGGGGGSTPTGTGAGGGGGCGGCGGSGGSGGMSGGSSFAVLSYKSALTFDTCILQGNDGGDGKTGGAGQGGEAGGLGGLPAQLSGAGCPGGTGGKGGDGAGGGGGAGGNAIAIGYVGMKPVTTSVTMSEGNAGALGQGGAGGAGNNGLSGAPGMKADVQELP